MPLANVSRLMQQLRQSWLIENFPHKLQIPRTWVWKIIEGTQIAFARTNRMDPAELAEISAGGCDTAVPERTDQPDSEAIFELVTIITRFQICMADIDRIRDPELLKQVLGVLADMRLMYRYFQRLGQATGGVSQFPGLQDIVGAGKTINMGGAALTFAALDQAYHLIESNQGRANAIMSNSRALRTFRNLYFGDGGGEPKDVPASWMDPVLGEVTAPITAFNGTPWYINDLIDDQAGETGIIYFMVLGDDGGPGHYRGITGLVPQGFENRWFLRRDANGLVGTGEATVGLDIPSVPFIGSVQAPVTIPTLPTVDTWVSWPTGVAMGSQGSLSILKGFNLVADLPTT